DGHHARLLAGAVVAGPGVAYLVLRGHGGIGGAGDSRLCTGVAGARRTAPARTLQGLVPPAAGARRAAGSRSLVPAMGMGTRGAGAGGHVGMAGGAGLFGDGAQHRMARLSLRVEALSTPSAVIIAL